MLRLGHPVLLWLLLVLPLLWWLARPVRPQQAYDSPHLRLWQRARERLGRRPPRYRGLRFVLALATALCLIAAAAGPLAFGRPGRGRLVLVFDRSPSMAARDGVAGTRLADAVAQARALLATVPTWIPVRVLGLGGAGPELLHRDAAPRTALAPVLDALAVGDGAADFGVLAASDWQPDDQLVVFTDGAGPSPAPDPWPAGAALAVVRVGSARANTGIAGLRVADHWPLPEIDLELVLVHADDAPRELDVVGGPHGQEQVLAHVHLPPQSLIPVAARVLRGEGGRFTVGIAGADVFPRDDRVAFVVAPPARPTVCVLAPEGPGRRALLAMVEALAAETAGRVVGEADAAQADLVLVDGGRLPTPPATGRGWLCFGTRAPGLIDDDARPLPAPVLADWDRTSPLLTGIDLSALRLRAALPLRADAGTPLLLGDQGPLAVTRDQPRALWFGCTLGDSTLATLPEFPRLLRRALAFLLRADTALAPAVEGLLDLHESRIAPTAAATPLPPIAWRHPELDLAPWLGLVALLLWTARAWLRP